MALRWYRELRFLDQKEVARAAGICRSYLCLLESGKKPLSGDLEGRIISAVDSLKDRTRERTIRFAVGRINNTTFYDSSCGEYHWRGSYEDSRAIFKTAGLKVELSHPVTEREELAARKAGRGLLSGRIRVDAPEGSKVRHFLILKSSVEASLEDFGSTNGPKVASLLTEMGRMLSLFWEVRPGTLARQIDEILQTKSK